MHELHEAAIVLRAGDSVVIARSAIAGGTMLTDGEQAFRVTADIPAGHKVAVRDVAVGAPVTKYGQPIGLATQAIRAGDHVHTHNLGMGEFVRDYAFGADVAVGSAVPASERATFRGIVRSDGHVATRNYIGILTSVNCSATAAKFIANEFRAGSAALEKYPNVDGVVALTHGTGCGMASSGEGMELLRRTLSGYARHPNFAGILVLGLGCEVNQVAELTAGFDLPDDKPVLSMTIQELGGTRATVNEGVARVHDMLAAADAVRRVTVPAGELVLGLECGGIRRVFRRNGQSGARRGLRSPGRPRRHVDPR